MHRLHRLYRYAIFLLDRFKYLVLAAVVAFALATWVLWARHPDQADPRTAKDLPEVAFGVFELMFASQPALPFPKGSPLCQAIFFALPVLNLLGLAAAVAQFSRIMFDRGLYNRAQASYADRHVILCGLGRLGREVLRQLDARHGVKRARDVVVIENGAGVARLEGDLIRREPIVPVIDADMTHAQAMRDAGIDRAVAVLLLTGDDTVNLEAALLAHELNPDVAVVVRMSNKRVSQRLDAMLRASPIRNFRLIDSVEGAAPRCVDVCQLPAAPATVPFGAAPEGPRADASSDLAEFGNVSDVSALSGHVVVCGLGRLGFGVVRLLKGRGAPVVVVDTCAKLNYADDPVVTSAPAVPVIRGDMTARRVLEQAGVARAAAVAILTPDDTVNLEAAMVVHEVNPNARIVMRIANSRIASRLDGVLRGAFGETLRVIDPSEHAAPAFVEAVGPVLGA